MKRCSMSLIIREMQIKTTVRLHHTTVRMAIIKHLQTINAGEGIEKRVLLYPWWECKLMWPLWGIEWRFLRKSKFVSYNEFWI